MAVRMSEKIAPSFYPVHKKLHDKQYTLLAERRQRFDKIKFCKYRNYKRYNAG